MLRSGFRACRSNRDGACATSSSTWAGSRRTSPGRPVDRRAGPPERVKRPVAEDLHPDLGQDPQRGEVDRLDLVGRQDLDRAERVDQPSPGQLRQAGRRPAWATTRSVASGRRVGAGGVDWLARRLHAADRTDGSSARRLHVLRDAVVGATARRLAGWTGERRGPSPGPGQVSAVRRARAGSASPRGCEPAHSHDRLRCRALECQHICHMGGRPNSGLPTHRLARTWLPDTRGIPMKWKVAAVVLLLAVGLGTAGFVVLAPGGNARAQSQYLTAAVSRGNVTQQVVATGSVRSAATYNLAFGSDPVLSTSTSSSSSSSLERQLDQLERREQRVVVDELARHEGRTWQSAIVWPAETCWPRRTRPAPRPHSRWPRRTWPWPRRS